MRLNGLDLIVRVVSEGPEQAEADARLLAEQFCDALSLRTGEQFSAMITQVIERPGESCERLAGARLHITWRDSPYKLDSLHSDVQHALTAATLSDETLRKSGAYFRHALFLHQEAWRNVVPKSIHWELLSSGALLNYYKAVSLIVGEAGTDHDYQSRYRRFGISRQLWEDPERLRKLRDDLDVAHYAAGWDRLEQVEKNLGFAKTTAGLVLVTYSEYLGPRPP